MIVAYFVGGPLDLSKQVLRGRMPCFTAFVPNPEWADKPLPAVCDTVRYVPRAQLVGRQNGADVVVYEAVEP